MKKKKKKKQAPKNPAYELGQALGALLILGALGSVLKEATQQEKPSPTKEKGDLKA